MGATCLLAWAVKVVALRVSPGLKPGCLRKAAAARVKPRVALQRRSTLPRSLEMLEDFRIYCKAISASAHRWMPVTHGVILHCIVLVQV